jgi:hypothetical protein
MNIAVWWALFNPVGQLRDYLGGWFGHGRHP